jgi:hypothetical protein
MSFVLTTLIDSVCIFCYLSLTIFWFLPHPFFILLTHVLVCIIFGLFFGKSSHSNPRHAILYTMRDMPSPIYYTLYTIHNYTRYAIHNTLDIIRYTRYTIRYTPYAIHHTLCMIRYTLCTGYTIHGIVCSVLCAACSVSCIVYSVSSIAFRV